MLSCNHLKESNIRARQGRQASSFVITIQTKNGIRMARPILRTVSELTPSEKGSLRPQTGQVRSLESVVSPHPAHCLISAFLASNESNAPTVTNASVVRY
jgi:hypothetical protein